MRVLTGVFPRNSPYLLIVLAMLCWSGNWLVGRAIRTEIPPLTLNFWRWVVAFLLLVPFTARAIWSGRQLILREWKILLALGFLGSALFHSLVYLALSQTTATNAVLYFSTVPIIIVCVSWLIFRDTVTARQGLGIFLSMTGAIGILIRGDPVVLLSLQFNVGDLWALASLPVWALYTVLLKRRPSELDGFATLTVMAGVAVVFMAPGFFWELGRGSRMEINAANLATIFYVGLFASVVAFAAWNSAVPRVGPNKAGVFSHLLPAFTIALAVLFLGERLQLFHFAGIALIAFGIFLTTVTDKIRQAP